MRRPSRSAVPAVLVAALAGAAAPAAPAAAQTVGAVQYVNGLAIPGATPDLSGDAGPGARLGFFSDIYYDRARGEYWGLSDRGPGGGTLDYETRVQRFTVAVNASTGAISGFQVQQTVKFRDALGAAFDGRAPSPAGVLGNSFDPEGFVVNPATGRFLVSDEYGPSLYEFNRDGTLFRRLDTPANLVPRGPGGPNFADDLGNVAGKRTNRGFEGLAVSPDGRYAYAMLQSAMLDEGAGGGLAVRIVKYDLLTGEPAGQFAYALDGSSQGRGQSALVALGNDRFLVLERNNRGLGVTPDAQGPFTKRVYQISLAGAADVTNTALTNANVAGVAVPKTLVLDLAANTLAELGNRVPEKFEGLAVGPRLDDGRYVLLVGTDNDYSVTQNAGGTQFDVYYRFTDADPYAGSIQCPIGTRAGCVFTAGGGAAALTAEYQLLPGVLQAYAADIRGYVAPASVVPEPGTVALTALGAAGLAGAAARRRRAA